jgi:hypothetical protein
MATTRAPRRTPCPYCGSRDTLEIIWGLYAPSDFEHPIPDGAMLGGCCIEPGWPQRHCNACGRRYDFRHPEQLDELTDPPRGAAPR